MPFKDQAPEAGAPRLSVDELRSVYSVRSIEVLVHRFYGRIREDPLLAPIFDARIRSWDVHLERMVDFWRSVLRAESRFKPSPRGDPLVLHGRIEELTLEHYSHWLGLFEETAREIYPEKAASYVLVRAQRIARSLAGGITS